MKLVSPSDQTTRAHPGAGGPWRVGRGPTWRAAALAVALAAPFVLIGLGSAPFDDPGEGMHAEIARELVLSRDPLALTLNGVRYVDKPPLLYALMAASFAVGGETERAARLVPALAALVAVGATAWLGAHLLGTAAGVLAGTALLTSVGFFAYARYVRPETLFVAALTLGFALTLVGLRDSRRGLVVGGLAALGAAGLAKDPLGAIGPLVVLGLALALAGRLHPWRRWLPARGVAMWLLLAFGWWGLAEWRTPGTLWYMAVDNHVLNVMRARHFPDEDVPLSAGAFLLVAALGATPWIVGAAVSAVDLLRRRAWREPHEVPWTVLTLWVIAVLGVTALSGFRLPHYGLPAYPAIALLAVRAWYVARPRALALAHAAVLAAGAVVCALAWSSDGSVFMSEVMGATDVATRKSAEAGQPAPLPPWTAFRPMMGAGAAVFGVGALVLMAGAARRGAAATGSLAPAVISATMLAALPTATTGLDIVASHRAVRGVAQEIARRAGPDDVVAHEGPVENSGALEWYSKRRPVIVDGQRSVLGFGATLTSARDVFWEGDRLRAAWEGGHRVWIVTGRPLEHSVIGHLPGVQAVATSAGRALYVNR